MSTFVFYFCLNSTLLPSLYLCHVTFNCKFLCDGHWSVTDMQKVQVIEVPWIRWHFVSTASQSSVIYFKMAFNVMKQWISYSCKCHSLTDYKTKLNTISKVTTFQSSILTPHNKQIMANHRWSRLETVLRGRQTNIRKLGTSPYSSWVKIRLQTKSQLPRLPETTWNLMGPSVVWWCWW